MMEKHDKLTILMCVAASILTILPIFLSPIATADLVLGLPELWLFWLIDFLLLGLITTWWVWHRV